MDSNFNDFFMNFASFCYEAVMKPIGIVLKYIFGRRRARLPSAHAL